MARYTGPVCRLCRADGRKLMLKGARCMSDKCPMNKKRGAPGKDPKVRAGKRSEYGLQLCEKQKIRRMYGMLEKQFRITYERAQRMPGVTGENFIQLLERRLDNVVYRMGMAASRKEARQLVLHAHFTLNGKKVNIPSILVKAGDVIAVKETSKESAKIKALIEGLATTTTPKWLELNAQDAVAKVATLPARDDIDFEFEEQLIVELYSK